MVFPKKVFETLKSAFRCRWLCWIQCCVSPRIDEYNDLERAQNFIERFINKSSDEATESLINSSESHTPPSSALDKEAESFDDCAGPSKQEVHNKVYDRKTPTIFVRA